MTTKGSANCVRRGSVNTKKRKQSYIHRGWNRKRVNGSSAVRKNVSWIPVGTQLLISKHVNAQIIDKRINMFHHWQRCYLWRSRKTRSSCFLLRLSAWDEVPCLSSFMTSWIHWNFTHQEGNKTMKKSYLRTPTLAFCGTEKKASDLSPLHWNS